MSDAAPQHPPIPPRRPPRIPPQTALTWATLHASGETTSDIAAIFGVNPRTVRRAIARVSEEEKRAIHQVVSAELVSLNAIVAKKALRELAARDLGATRTDKEGNEVPVISALQLMTCAGIASDKVKDLAESAGMASDSKNSGGNPMSSWFLTQERAAEALRGLPAGTKMRVKVAQEVEVGSGSGDSPNSSESAVSAEFSVEDESK